MRLRFLVGFLICLFCFDSSAQSKSKVYRYSLDISDPVDDRIFVSLIPPRTRDKEVFFYMPKVIPGTYAVADYGRYVKDFLAYDKSGKGLEVQKVDDNTWKITATKKIARITYWVDDTYDTPAEGPEIFWPAGTNVEEDKDYIINPCGFFGYIGGKTTQPFEISITRPEDFYGSTGLVPVKSGVPARVQYRDTTLTRATDLYRTNGYAELVDSPILYARPDTATFPVANTKVLIGSYSPNGMIKATEIAETIKEVLTAQAEYLGGQLPVNKYAFIFYFTDQPVVSYGALEHSYSSLYYMPEATIDQLKQELRDNAAHEFFHIVTPLTVHSKEIAEFDFNAPKMSRHLWMYEGVTEYFAGHVQVKSGLITAGEYLNMMYDKMETADQFIDNVPFTEISADILDKYHDQFYNVYQKGALIGLCLDLQLLKLSGGKYGVRNLMLDLSKRFGKQKAFDDAELFDVIASISYPEIRQFFKRYVEGPEPLPFEEVFSYVGINYQKEEKFLDYNLGLTNADIDVTEVESKPRLQIINSSNHNEMGKALGFHDGDVIVAINGEAMPDLGPELSTFMGKQYRMLPQLKNLSYTVLRKDHDDTWKEIELSAPVRQIEITKRHLIIPDPNATKEQLKLRDSWLK